MPKSLGGKSSVPDTNKPRTQSYTQDDWERISRVMMLMAKHATNSVPKLIHLYHAMYGKMLTDGTMKGIVKTVQSEDAHASTTLKDMLYRRISHAELDTLNSMIAEFEKLVMDNKDESDIATKYWKTLNEMYQRRQTVIEEVLLYIHEVTTVKEETQFEAPTRDLDRDARAKAAKNSMLNPVEMPSTKKLYPAVITDSQEEDGGGEE